LKSLGLEKYDSADSPVGGTWEQELRRTLDKNKLALPDGKKNEEVKVDYEVTQPEVPDSIKKIKKEEEELTGGIYD